MKNLLVVILCIFYLEGVWYAYKKKMNKGMNDLIFAYILLGGIFMDKVKEMENSFNHGISIAERKNILVTGVKKIESFDNEEFLMDTTLGFLVIKGSELEIIKLDTYQGNVSIKGNVDSLSYVSKDLKKEKEESFISKLFK